MSKYRKKPIIIEAFQLTLDVYDDEQMWPNWLKQASELNSNIKGAVYRTQGDMLCIYTLEGDYDVSIDDYVIKGIKGELYPCKPDIFEATYEKVKND